MIILSLRTSGLMFPFHFHCVDLPPVMFSRLFGFFLLLLLDAVNAGCKNLIVIDHGIILLSRTSF